MDSGGEIEDQVLEFQKKEEVFEYKYSEICDSMLSFGLVNQLKTQIKTFKDQGTDLYGVFTSHFFLSKTNPQLSIFS